MKKITNKKIGLQTRTGGAVIILALLVVVLLIATGMALFNGSQKQAAQTQLLSLGYQLFNDGNFAEAHKQFGSAKQTFTKTLDLFRKVKKSADYVNSDDLNELLISVCLSAAYEDFFELKSSEEWLSKAEEELKHHSAGERKNELTQLLATAKAVSKLCQTFADGNIENTMKSLLEVEKSSLATDQDFFIFEIRMLIACGKKLEDPDVINQARELLFFATTDAGINNDKTGKLWVLLTN